MPYSEFFSFLSFLFQAQTAMMLWTVTWQHVWTYAAGTLRLALLLHGQCNLSLKDYCWFLAGRGNLCTRDQRQSCAHRLQHHWSYDPSRTTSLASWRSTKQPRCPRSRFEAAVPTTATPYGPDWIVQYGTSTGIKLLRLEGESWWENRCSGPRNAAWL